MALRNRDLTFIVKVQNMATRALRELRRDMGDVGRAGNEAARGTDNAAAAQRRAAVEAARAAAAARARAAAARNQGQQESLLTRIYDASRDALAHWRNVGVNAFDTVRDAMNHMGGSGAFLRAGLGAALLATTALVTGFGLAVRGVMTDYAAFDKQMASVNAALREGNEPIDKLGGKFGMLRDKAKELSAATEYSATEVASGMDNLVRAGFNAAQTAAAIKPSLDLATTGNMNLADTTERLGAIMSQYQLDATKATAVTDILAFVNAKTAAGIPDLAQAFKYAGSTSHAMGISVNETAAALGVLADNGIKGFAAGTAVRELELDLLRLANGTAPKKAQAALASLKIDKDKIDPRKVGLLDAIKALEGAKIDKAQMDAMFGSRGITPFTALAADLKKAGDLYKESADQAGYNARQADDMRNNLATSIDKMKKAWSNMMIAIGDSGFGNAIQKVVEGIAGAITKVKEFIEWLNSGTPGAKAFAAAMTIIGSALLIYGVAAATAAIGTAAIAGAIGTATIATIAWTAALLTNPLVWIIGIVAAAVAAIMWFGESTWTANGKAISGWNLMKAVVAGVVAWVKTALSTLADNVSTIFGAIAKAVATLATGVNAALHLDFAGAKAAFSNVFSSFQNMELKNVGDEAGKSYATAFNAAVAKAPKAPPPGGKPKQGGPAGVVRGGETDTMLDSEQDTRDNGSFLPGKKDKSKESEANKFKNALNSLMQTLVPVIERSRKYAENMGLLNRGLREGKITQDQYNAAVGNLEESTGQTADAIGKVTLALQNENRTLGLAEGSREAANRVFALENDMRKDGIAYLKDGVLQMDADTRKRYENAKAMIAQSVAAKALQDAKDETARADDDNRIAQAANALPDAQRAAYEIAQKKIADLRRKGVTDEIELAQRGAEAVRTTFDAGRIAGQRANTEAMQDATLQLNALGMVGYAKERYLAVEQKRLELLRSGNVSQADANVLAEDYGKILDKQRDATMQARTDMVQGLRDGLKEWIDSASDIAGNTKNLITNVMGNFADTFTEFLTTGKASFGDFLRSTLQGITQIITQLLMLKALKAVSGPLGISGLFHTGGMVGQAAKTSRAVNPAIFEGARRLHTGGMVDPRKNMNLKPGERPIIALDTERVLNPEETKAYNAGLAASGVRTATAAPAQSGGAGGQPVVFAPQFNQDFSGMVEKATGGAGMSAKEKDALMKGFKNDMTDFMERWLQNEQRPGGRLAPRR